MDSYNTVTWAEGGNLSQQIPDKHNPVRQKIKSCSTTLLNLLQNIFTILRVLAKAFLNKIKPRKPSAKTRNGGRKEIRDWRESNGKS